MIYMPEVGGFCEVSCEDHADYDWVKIHVVHIHNGVVIGVVDMPGELIHDDIEKYSVGYNRAVFREITTEAAIAAPQPVWNGEGLPPIGCECEISPPIHNAGTRVRVLCHDEGSAVCRILEGDKLHSLCQLQAKEIRPLRTEADRKRERTVDVICGLLEIDRQCGARTTLERIYNWIEFGRIPGLRLADD